MKVTFKQFRELLNAQSENNYKNGKYHQESRKYGDYLYFQDRARFDYYFELYLQFGNKWEEHI